MMHVKAGYRRKGKEREFDPIFCDSSAEFWEKLAPPIADNYILRWGVRGGYESRRTRAVVAKRIHGKGEGLRTCNASGVSGHMLQTHSGRPAIASSLLPPELKPYARW
jgi:hypothetical protein